jgi:repressor LexA
MIESHISDGDYVVIRKQESADNGDKVVAMVEKAMTLKKFYKRKDHVRLEPANGTMDPILVDPTKHDVSVLGVLVGVIRKC